MDRTVERQLAKQHAIGDLAALDDALRGQDAQSNWQIERGARFPHIRGGKIHRDAVSGELEARIANGGPYAVAALADARVGQAHHRKAGKSERDVDFDLDGTRLDPENGGRSKAGKHMQTPKPEADPSLFKHLARFRSWHLV